MKFYVVKLIEQEVYLKADETKFIEVIGKSNASTMSYEAAHSVVNELNRECVLNNESKRYEMASA